MNFIAEYLDDTNRILLRAQNPGIQLGVYALKTSDGKNFSFEVESLDVVVNDEVDFYLGGFYPAPASIEVTLPDTSTITVATVQYDGALRDIKNQGLNDNLKGQFDTVAAPPVPPEHRPGESGNVLRPIEVQASPALPKYWAQLNFEQPDPLSIDGSIGISSPLSYTGGGIGRALSTTIRQPIPDSAPWLLGASMRLEGGFTNSLSNSEFYPLLDSPNFFDKVPQGWDFSLTNPSSLLRIYSSSGAIGLPELTLVWSPEPGAKVTDQPALLIQTPTVSSGQTFQVIVSPGVENDLGSLQAKTANLFASSPVYSTTTPFVLNFDVGANGGRVKLYWNPDTQSGKPQVIKLSGPIASSYTGPHSWIPFAQASSPDRIQLSLTPPTSGWAFNTGAIVFNSSLETPATPISWSLMGPGGENFLTLLEGQLTSDYSTSPPCSILSALNPTAPGVYTLRWVSPTETRLIAGVSGEPLEGRLLPFTLDSLVATPIFIGPLSLTLRSYAPNQGAAILKSFRFQPR